MLAKIVPLGRSRYATDVVVPGYESTEPDNSTNVELNFGGILIRPGEYCYADRDCVIVLDKPVHG